MLLIDKISIIKPYSPEWFNGRLWKITASKIGLLMSEKSHEGKFTQNAKTLIRKLVHEIKTGKQADDEFFNDDVNWGNAHEPEMIKHYEQQYQKTVYRDIETGATHKLLIQDEYCACTPDALITNTTDINKVFDSTGTRLKATPFEGKCPRKGHRFIELYECNTPEDLKKAESKYYWQMLFQMWVCESSTGVFAFYHPYYPFNERMKVINFEKVNLQQDFINMIKTINHAKTEILKTKKIFQCQTK